MKKDKPIVCCEELSSSETICVLVKGHDGQHECHYGYGCCWHESIPAALTKHATEKP